MDADMWKQIRYEPRFNSLFFPSLTKEVNDEQQVFYANFLS